MKGGCETGFRMHGPNGYVPRLFQICGEKSIINVTQIPFKRGNLNSDDVFVIDTGLRIFQFNGETANKDEKFKATMYVTLMKAARFGKSRLDILEETSISPRHRFYRLLPDGKSKEKEDPPVNPLSMHKVSDVRGTMEIDCILDGSIDKGKLNSSNVILVNSGRELFIWIGKGANQVERLNAFGFAHRYLKDKPNPFVPVFVIKEGQKCASFDHVFERSDEDEE